MSEILGKNLTSIYSIKLFVCLYNRFPDIEVENKSVLADTKDMPMIFLLNCRSIIFH